MDSRLKVLIVGGSITGLSLALMLERVGIDFLLLEAHVDIAPEVGASIGLCPNGLRILDQLGCYDSLQEKSQNHIVNNSWYGTLDGRKVKEFEGLGGAVIERHGYPLSFIDRRMLLQHLYDSLRQKHKVLTGKRVVSIVKSDNVAVIIRTEDASSYTGDVLVGADGIHSRVRREMARLDPAHDYIESASLHAHWACLFGISRNVPGIAKGDVGYVFGNRFSYLLGDGPGDRSYFFLTKRLQKRVFGSDIPRFSDKDKEAFVKPHLDDQITSGLRFRDMYDKRMTSVLVPLEEIVYKRWHHSRIIAIGDSSSKMLPITGQGGNSAIENAAVLTNNLFDCLKASPQNKPTVEQLDIAFEKVQELRTPRLQKFVTIANQRQALDAMLTPEIKEFALTQMPQLGAEVILRGFQKEFGQAASLNMLPVPYRPRTVPYADEQPQENSKKGDIVAKL